MILLHMNFVNMICNKTLPAVLNNEYTVVVIVYSLIKHPPGTDFQIDLLVRFDLIIFTSNT